MPVELHLPFTEILVFIFC